MNKIRTWLWTMMLLGAPGVSVMAQNDIIAFNQGADVYIQPGLDVYVGGGVYNQSGSWTLNGNLHISDSLRNDANNGMFLNAGAPGTVFLTKNTDQRILGTQQISFPVLTLQGTGGVKILEQNAEVRQQLNFNNRNVNAQGNILHVLNTNAASAVTTSGGFLAANSGGGLRRSTNATNAYSFPVGGLVLGERRVNITPSNASANTYTVRMAPVDATTEGFDRNDRAGTICEVNPTYYHQVTSTASASSLSINFTGGDAITEVLAHWAPQWTQTPGQSRSASMITLTNWNNTHSNLAFANLGVSNPTLTASTSTYCPNFFIPIVLTGGATSSAGTLEYTFLNNTTNAVLQGPGISSQFTASDNSITSYRVRVARQGSTCPAVETTLNITFRPDPAAASSTPVLTGGADLCAGNTSGLQVTNPISQFQYQWSRNGTAFINFGNTTSTQQGQAGNYTVIARDPLCGNAQTTQSNSVAIRVASGVDADFFDNLPAPGADGLPEITTDVPVMVIDNSSADFAAGDNITSWLWNFGNGQTSTDQFPAAPAVYTQDGTYTIRLTVTSAFGCTDFIERSLRVASNTAFLFPSAFSPNNDGLNDSFYWRIENITNFNFMVFNRWGEKIFETRNPTEYWDGFIDGKPAPEGVYVFVASGTNRFTNQEMKKNGTITLVR
ncbi:MAG: gliding motility-associated C-terminal domain-containing protein [Bacteroidetes bacterium]|nr:gliding motility-associated C-terminal domain-containing protein [Bacteroidota bacterium]